jgi:putative addiction module component (TIGR02574 family)
MSQKLDELVEQAMGLAMEERAELADRIWESLTGPEQAEIDAAWGAEAERRITEMENGTVKGIPADEVFRSLERPKR